MERVWTGRNQRGELQFRGFYFGASELSPAREHAFDVIAHALAVSPALYVWQQTRDPKLGRPLTAWLDTWVSATARAENGKPAGVLPAALHWPDGQAAGIDNHWWEPVPVGGSGAHYYVWPSVLPEMTDALLTAYLVTRENKYLTPIRSMADLRLRYLKNPPAEALAPGTEAWCAAGLGPRATAHNGKIGPLVKTLVKCRTLTGTREFDELIALDGGDHLGGAGAGNRKAMESALRSSIQTLRSNFPAFTSEVRYTDRVLAFPRFLALSDKSGGMTGAALPGYDLIYAMVSGDSGSGRTPLPAVRWRTSPQDLAAWVTVADRSHLEAELFHFGMEPRPLSAELRLLAPGRYRVELLQEGLAIGPAVRSLEVKGPLSTMTFDLPPRKLCLLRVLAAADR